MTTKVPGWSHGKTKSIGGHAAVRPRLLIGCGTGRDLLALRQLGCDVTGLEQSTALAEEARATLSTHGLPTVVIAAAIESYAPHDTFDVIVFSPYTYSYILGMASRVGILGRLRERLSARGKVIISYPRLMAQSSLWIFLARVSSACGGSDWWPEAGDRLYGPASLPTALGFEHQFSPMSWRASVDWPAFKSFGMSRSVRISDSPLRASEEGGISNHGLAHGAQARKAARKGQPPYRDIRDQSRRYGELIRQARPVHSNQVEGRPNDFQKCRLSLERRDADLRVPLSGSRKNVKCFEGNRTAVRFSTGERQHQLRRTRVEGNSVATREDLSRHRRKQLQAGRSWMRKPASVASLEREHVVGENRESPCEKRGSQRRLSVSAVAEERDSFTVDDHRRRVQRFSAA